MMVRTPWDGAEGGFKEDDTSFAAVKELRHESKPDIVGEAPCSMTVSTRPSEMVLLIHVRMSERHNPCAPSRGSRGQKRWRGCAPKGVLTDEEEERLAPAGVERQGDVEDEDTSTRMFCTTTTWALRFSAVAS